MVLESNLPKPEQPDLLCNCGRGAWKVNSIAICPEKNIMVESTIKSLECLYCTGKYLLYDKKLYSAYGQDASRVVAEFVRSYNEALVS